MHQKKMWKHARLTCMLTCPLPSPSLNNWARRGNAKLLEPQVWVTAERLDYSVYSSVSSLKSKSAAAYLELAQEIGLQFAADEHVQGYFMLNTSGSSFMNEAVSQAAPSRSFQPCATPVFYLLGFIWDLQIAAICSWSHWWAAVVFIERAHQ